MRREFDNLAGELHHLISTKSIAGVYNPPYNDMLPRAFEKPIEQHLRESCQVRVPASLRCPKLKNHSASSSPTKSRGYLEGSLHAGPPQDLPDRDPHQSRSASVGRMQKVQGPFRSKEQIEISNAKASNIFRSVQSSSAYDVEQTNQRMQTKLAKLTRASPMDFNPVGMAPDSQPPSSVHVGAPYRNRPSEMRGDYTELPKIRDKPPFFTALQRDKHFHDYNEKELLPFGSV